VSCDGCEPRTSAIAGRLVWRAACYKRSGDREATTREDRNEGTSRERERRARGAVGVGSEGRDGAAKTISNAAWPLAFAPTVISSRKPLRAMKYVTFEPSLASSR
jgi:hypothetical protein